MTPRAAFACALVATLLAGSAAVAEAQAPAPTIEPDRPDVTNGPHLVPAGMVQFELGGIFARERSDGHTAAAPVSVRIGVNKVFEARFGIDNRFSVTGENLGFGTVQAGAKIRL
jgi:hypothetical protein